MAEHSGFFNTSETTPRKYQDLDFARMLSLLTGGQGYIVGYGSELKVIDSSTVNRLKVNVKSGAAWIGEPSGWWYINDDELELDLGEPLGSGNYRTDRIVLRLNRNTGVLSVSAVVLCGDTDAPLTAPPITRDDLKAMDAQYDLALAQVYVDGDTGSITIADERDTELCGALIVGGGGGGSGTEFTPSSIKVGTADLTLVKWNTLNGEWEGSDTGYMVYYDGKLYGSGSMVAISGYSADDEKTAFAASDGVVSTALGGTIVGAFCEGGNYLSVCVQSEELGVPNEYEENMQSFFAIPAASQEIWLRVQMPSDAEGVLIRRKSEAWQLGEDETDGEFVADISDESQYKGNNEWYKVTGLTNGGQYFFKAFPYKGSIYNTLYNENISDARPRVGLFLLSYDSDDISGSTLVDKFSANNFIASNATYQAFKVGDGIIFNGTNTLLSRANFLTNNFTFITWYKSNNTSRAKILLSESYVNAGYGWGWSLGVDDSGDMWITVNNGTICTAAPKYSISTNLTVNTTYMLTYIVNLTAKTLNVYVNDAYIGNASLGTNSTNGVTTTYIGYAPVSYSVGGTRYISQYSKAMELDQSICFDGSLTEYDIGKIYNNGNGI